MAKKKRIKNFKLEQEELQPLTIGVFESRKKSSIGTVVILLLFVLFIVFLPQISDIVNSYLNPEVPSVNPSNPVNPVEPGDNPDPGAEEDFYEYTTDLKITNDDITVSNFIVDTTNNTLSYTITNNGDSQDIEALNYYIEIYNSDRTLIERVKLASELNLLSGAYRSITKNISSDAATTVGYIVLIKKTIVEYPEVNLNISGDGSSSLVCTINHEKVTYKFKESKLKELISEVTYKIEDVNYETILEEHKILVNNYNSKTGAVSTMFEYEGGYNITTSVNLSEASRLYVFNADSFSLDTEPKVVKFEMEAQGFKCE